MLKGGTSYVRVRNRTRPAIAAIAIGAAVSASCSSPRATETRPTASSDPAIVLPAPIPPPSNAALIARAQPLELSTAYEPPPGDPLEHNTSGYTKTMCSAVFITGLDPDVAAESVGYFTGPVR